MMIPSALAAIAFTVLAAFQVTGIYAGDSGDLVTAASVGGVPHPPGYPLFTLLGYLLTRLPLLTPSWRVTLLSSLSHAAVIGLTYAFTRRITGSTGAAAFSAAVLLGNYLFFLYGVTPEVFALFDLFALTVLYVSYRILSEKNVQLVPALAGIMGLALTHHHVILFLVPAVAFALVSVRRELARGIRSLAPRALILFALGLLPYAYVPLAAAADPVINWDNAVNPGNFLRLITRADYGSFVSGGAIGHSMYERLLSVLAYFQFTLTDWTAVGILAVLFGLYRLFSRNRNACWFFVIAVLGIGPLFFFYASFPLVNKFLLGTYERFLLPGYLVFAVLAGIALDGLFTDNAWLARYFRKRPSVKVAAYLILLLYPVTQLSLTAWRFWGMRNDRTADNLARDLLAAAPPNAIVLLTGDTALFTSQYVRYALSVRPDTAVIQASRLVFPEYRHTLAKRFPEIQFPPESDSSYWKPFILANIAKRPVVSNTVYGVGSDWLWVPSGMLFRVVSKNDAPPIGTTLSENRMLFSGFHDPRAGVLSRYPHLMLNDVLDLYAYAHINLADALVRAGLLGDAKTEYAAAAAYDGDTSSETAWTRKGITETALGLCDDAMRSYAEAESRMYADRLALLKYRSLTLRDCYHDATGAAGLERQIESLKRARETPLGQ